MPCSQRFEGKFLSGERQACTLYWCEQICLRVQIGCNLVLVVLINVFIAKAD